MLYNICKTCGGTLVQRDAYLWECTYCNNTYTDESVRREEETLRSLLDGMKIERVSNLRRNLYDALRAEYTDSEAVRRICFEIKTILPDDFMADFFCCVNGTDVKASAEYVNSIDVNVHGEYVEIIIDFMLRSFVGEYHLPLAGLIERAYRETDLDRLDYYSTRLAEEAEKESSGVYETSLTRDVFVAYSSKDMDHVYPLVSYLEESGLTCFVAARNLRHGSGAVQNYNSAIKEAISSCRSIVFVSTPDSRSFSCDALRFELPYVKQEDIANAPYEYKQNYVRMPYKYKKPRVEYRKAESRSQTAADLQVKEFFEGCEYAYNVREVASRIIDLLSADYVEEGPSGGVLRDTDVEPLLRRAFIFLESEKWQSADEYCERVLDREPENARAYLGKLMAEMKVSSEEALGACVVPFENNVNYRCAVRFADRALKARLEKYARSAAKAREKDTHPGDSVITLTPGGSVSVPLNEKDIKKAIKRRKKARLLDRKTRNKRTMKVSFIINMMTVTLVAFVLPVFGGAFPGYALGTSLSALICYTPLYLLTRWSLTVNGELAARILGFIAKVLNFFGMGLFAMISISGILNAKEGEEAILMAMISVFAVYCVNFISYCLIKRHNKKEDMITYI